METPGGTVHKLGLGAILTALLLSAMWGANIVSVKVGVQAIPPLWAAFWRMLLGFPVLAAWAWYDNIPVWPEPQERKFLILLGVIFGVQIMLLNISINLTSAAYAVVLLNSNPVFTNLIAHFFVPEDRLSWGRALGLGVAFAGVCVVFIGRPEARQASDPLLGNLIATATAVLIGARLVYTRRLVQSIPPARAVFWQVLVSIPMFLAAAWWFEPLTVGPVTLAPVLAILYQAFIVAGIGFMLWVRLLEKHPPGAISVFTFPTPVFGVIFSAILFSEKISPALVAGAVGVVLGILITTWKGRPDPAVAEGSGQSRRLA